MAHSLFDKEKREKWVAFVQSLNPDIDPSALRLMDEMRAVARTLYHIGESSVTAAEMSYAKYRLLMGLFFSEEIEGRGELNPSEISERQGTSRNTISALIRTLEDEMLVERRLDQSDRRKFKIKLTEDGRSRVHDHMRRHLRIIDECFSGLTTEEQETLSQLLTKVRTNAIAAKERYAETSDQETGA